jgi:hypothetical protein
MCFFLKKNRHLSIRPLPSNVLKRYVSYSYNLLDMMTSREDSVLTAQPIKLHLKALASTCPEHSPLAVTFKHDSCHSQFPGSSTSHRSEGV